MSQKVSILVPIYKVEKFIERCAISLFEQTFDSIEYLFIDDCSPDGSIKVLNELIKRYPNRKEYVRIIKHEKNLGLAGARNTGIDYAVGEYILHVDSDDYLDIDTVEVLFGTAIKENADIVACDFLFEWNNASQIVKQNIGDNKDHFIQLMLSAQALVGLVNKLFKRELYIKNNIRAVEGVNLGEDFITTPRLVYYSNKVVKVNRPLYHYIQTNENSYTKNLTKQNIDNVVFVLNYLSDFFNKTPNSDFYLKALLEGKLRKKMDMLFFADESFLKDLLGLFPETDGLKDVSFLMSRDRISYPLIQKGLINLFLLYRKSYRTLFYFKNKIKGIN